MFGRKRKVEDVQSEATVVDESVAELDEVDATDAEELDSDLDAVEPPEAPELAEVDWRAEGPFDYEEVDQIGRAHV